MNISNDPNEIAFTRCVRCRDCKHWTVMPNYNTTGNVTMMFHGPNKVGVCSKLTGLVSQTSDAQTFYLSTLAPSNYRGSEVIHTGLDFGCVLGERKM